MILSRPRNATDATEGHGSVPGGSVRGLPSNPWPSACRSHSGDVPLGVVARADERTGLDLVESHLEPQIAEFVEFRW